MCYNYVTPICVLFVYASRHSATMMVKEQNLVTFSKVPVLTFWFITRNIKFLEQEGYFETNNFGD